MERPHANPGMLCPLLKQDMAEVCHKCPLWTQLRGTHPQTGEPIQDEWSCAFAWLPVLLIESTQMSRQTGAAVETFRNAMVEANEQTLDMLQQSRLKALGG